MARSAAAAALRLHAFPDQSSFTASLAKHLGRDTTAIDLHRFPDGESLVRVQLPAGRHAVVVRTLDHPNAKLLEVLLAADALRRAGAARVTLVAPYLPYMRQDKIFHPGEPLSQHVVARSLRQAFDQVLTLEAHLHRITSLQEILPGKSLSAAPAVAAWVNKHAPGALVVGPDSESTPWVRAVARAADSPWLVGTKQRRGDRRVAIEFLDFEAVTHAVLVDDIASSGVTLAVAARELQRRGVRRIDAVVVHAIFAPAAKQRIHRAGVRRVISCNSIAHESNGIDCAAYFAAALRR